MSGHPRWDVASAVRFPNSNPWGGDAAVIRETPDGYLLAIIDALGHGMTADPARRLAIDYLARAAIASVLEILGGLDSALAGSVGAAAGVCRLEAATGRIEYAGIGNVAVRIFGSRESRLLSRDGVLGQRAPRPRAQTGVVEAGDVLLMHTDGLPSRFELARYPRLLRDPARVAATTLVRDYAKAHDDAACIVVARPDA
jgi:hypothetical protein